MRLRDVLLVVSGAILGALISFIARSGSGTTGPSSDRADEVVAALERQVNELRHQLAERPPPPLAAAPVRQDSATGTPSSASATGKGEPQRTGLETVTTRQFPLTTLPDGRLALADGATLPLLRQNPDGTYERVPAETTPPPTP